MIWCQRPTVGESNTQVSLFLSLVSASCFFGLPDAPACTLTPLILALGFSATCFRACVSSACSGTNSGPRPLWALELQPIPGLARCLSSEPMTASWQMCPWHR